MKNEKDDPYGSIPTSEETSAELGKEQNKVDLNQRPPNTESSNTNLIENLLDKCKVTNLPHVYMKYLDANHGLCTLEQLLSFDGYFTEENIKRDLESIPNIVLLKIYPEALHRFFIKPIGIRNKSQKNGFEYVSVLLTTNGLAKILDIYKQDGYIDKKITLNQIYEVFQVEENTQKKINTMLRDAMKTRLIYAVIEKGEDGEHYMLLTGKFRHPSNKSMVNQIVFLSVLCLIISVILIWIAYPILF